jgi:hypothetical protein
MKPQIMTIQKVEQNKSRLTLQEAKALAEQIKTTAKEAEVHFKSGESKLKTCAPLIERMIKCKGEGGKDGWELMGYKNFNEWSKEHLQYDYPYARTFYKAIVAYIELKESNSQTIVEFTKDAAVSQLAAIGSAPEGSRVELVMAAKEIAEEVGSRIISERIIQSALKKLKPTGVEEDKLETLTSELAASNKEWRKTTYGANVATLNKAKEYWEKELPQAEKKKLVESRIKSLSQRINYLEGKVPSGEEQQPITRKERQEIQAEKKEVKKNLSIEFATGGLLSIEDPETFSTYIEVVPKERIWNELQNIKERQEKLMDNLDDAGSEIVRLTQQIKRLEAENKELKKKQGIARGEWGWELDVTDIVAQLNGKKTVVFS